MRIRLDNVGVEYGKYKAVDGVSFEVGPGEVLSIVGPNGSGKSSIIKCIAQVLKPSTGKVYLDGRDISSIDLNEIAKLVGYVPQNFHYLFFSNVMETVLLGRKPHIRWRVTQKDLDVVQRALDMMGIAHMAGKFMDELSGGEKQKVYIARTLAQEPQLYLLDEPTSNLDLKHQIEVLEITRRLTYEKNASMIVALHDLNLALRYSDRVAMMNRGRLYAYGKPEDVLTIQNINDVYGVETFIIESDYGRYIVPIRAK
ncbi:ABC-type cobalamin/Fe3+-siderophores transport system, ATPase component [Methanocella conradii HZ254]|uniref:Cobalamin import ATP-binding protein BtuD n=1 Tax=Methanocella conradii (strain DSM 24694 / JCM 17849 / CGMCC 1.5162 / HZ254) TaxID=1041930 RepID=H8IB18_METCZ|nr:ABC transporter ATP-binding protein [Methanocella conradii]AFD01028.1 ABC-type cobalamin/Fe3+-siderophores transport system, ATPase component [Methanocella conradii HZ254]MDI6897623.1 ABC transporter ATP-binding protein [Methanocella conradii]